MMHIEEEKLIKEFWEIIPVEVMKQVMNEFHLKNSVIHGISHWSRVFYYGATLSKIHNIDLEIIAYFSIFHDSKRMLEDDEPEHGPSAAEFFKKLDSIIFIKPENKEIIYEACRTHNLVDSTDIKEIGVCYDADRLDLWRVSLEPSDKYLHFDISKQNETKDSARIFTRHNFSKTLLSESILTKVYNAYDIKQKDEQNHKLNFIDKFFNLKNLTSRF